MTDHFTGVGNMVSAPESVIDCVLFERGYDRTEGTSRAILSALTTAGYAVEQGWQDISTAPRDGHAMSALLPDACPICRGKAMGLGKGAGLYAIVCTDADCKTEGPTRIGVNSAIAAWNRRATPAEVEALRARVERLEASLRECANDLEAYVMREYSGDVLTPGNALRRARDLAPVDAARAALEDRNDDQ